MINHTKKYLEMTDRAVERLSASGRVTPKMAINAFSLKVNGDERLVIRVGLNAPCGMVGEGTSVHNPIDDFDPTVGILLASARAYKDLAKRIREEAYQRMMRNAEVQRIRFYALRDQKMARELCKDPDVIIMRAEAHQARLLAALDDGRVFYCPECKGHFANNGKVAQPCPHCKKGHARKYWLAHRLDEFKDEKEAVDGEKGTVPSDPLP